MRAGVFRCPAWFPIDDFSARRGSLPIVLPLIQYLMLTITGSIFVALLGGTCPAEDVVVVQRVPGDPLIKRRGTIVEWKGNSLTLDTAQRERAIANEEIVQIETVWPPSYQEALPFIANGEFQQGGRQLILALKDETRPWAKRIMRAELIRVLMALDQADAALEQFLMIHAEDPDTRFFYLCPLKWISTSSIADAKSNLLLKSPEPVEQLIGASWLIPSRQQEEATQVLERLTHDLDPRVQKIATTQLWRLRGLNLGSINDRQVAVWETQIAELPEKFRAGPWYFVAEVQMKRKQTESAILNWLRIPILYPDQYALAAAALYQASLLLENEQQTENSESLRIELKQKYRETIWARQLPTRAAQ